MDKALNDLVAKDRILDVVNRLFLGTDQRDWPAVQDCFAESVLFDMTSVAGGEPARMSPAQITDAWEAGLRPIESIHHQTGNHQVAIEGERANVFCYGIALHYRRSRSGRDTRTFVGSYDIGLLLRSGGWKIDRFRFNLKFLDGNLDLEKGG
jgi:hypothetical protein